MEERMDLLIPEDSEVKVKGSTESNANGTPCLSEPSFTQDNHDIGDSDTVMHHSSTDMGNENTKTNLAPASTEVDPMKTPLDPNSKVRPELDTDVGDHISAETIPRRFVQWGQEFPSIRYMIAPGQYLTAKVVAGQHPTSFRVRLLETQNEFGDFLPKLQTWVQRSLMVGTSQKLKSRCIPNAACIVPGLFILCACPIDKVWRRARVTSLVKNGEFMVELIDFGFEIQTSLSCASYILPDMMTALPPQSIRCRLQFGRPYDSYVKKGKCWSEEARAEFIRQTLNKTAQIHFKKPKVETDYFTGLEEVVWHVKINTLTRVAADGAPEKMDTALTQHEVMELCASNGARSVKYNYHDLSNQLIKFIPIPTDKQPNKIDDNSIQED